MSGLRSEPRNVLVIGWFPAADATSAGRFVADQVAALAATGDCRPSVVAFENAAVRGPAGLRDREAAAVSAAGKTAIEARSPFNARGVAGPAGVPLARLTVAGGETPESGPDHRAIHHEAVLRPLVDRPDARRWHLVHAHVGYPAGAAAARAAARLGVPLVITEHATYLASLLAEPIVRARYRDAALAAARVIAVSRMLADELIDSFPELGGRVVVIPNTVAVDDFGGGEESERVPGELLWVGNRSETKGTAMLLEAFARVHERRPETVLRLIGRSFRPEHERDWQRLAAQLGVAEAVRFEPPADRAGVADAMRRADLFVHASNRETFGVVAVEALASGLPVVATDSGGVTEVLGDDPERLGALVPAGNPAAFSAAVLGALERRSSFDPAVLRAHAAENFGAARVASRIVELYEEVLDGSDRGARVGDARQEATAGLIRADSDLPDRTVVVAFSRAELDAALASFPGWVLARAELVTSGGPVKGRPDVRLAPATTEARLADLLGWGAPPIGRLGRLARRLRRAARRAIGRRTGGGGDPATDVLTDLRSVLGDVLPAAPGPDAPLLVCVGGIDHLAAGPFIAEGRAIPAPGGLRWLADLRGATQADAPSPASSEA